jgi:hypothetical protein
MVHTLYAIVNHCIAQCKHTPGFNSVWADTIPLSNLHEYLDRYWAVVPVRWLRRADVWERRQSA